MPRTDVDHELDCEARINGPCTKNCAKVAELEQPTADRVSLRDYFAGKALPAVVDLLERDSETDDFPSRVALISYEIADAMRKEREEA